jgi:hypothetical protein
MGGNDGAQAGEVDLSEQGQTEEPIAKPAYSVTPAKAGVQNALKRLDSGFRRNDAEGFLQLALNVKFIGAVGAVFGFYAGNVKRSHPWFPRELFVQTWQELAQEKGMIFLSGPRQSGKTTPAKRPKPAK